MKEERKKGFENVRRLRTRVQKGKALGGTTQRGVVPPSNELADNCPRYLQSLEARKLATETINHRRDALNQFFIWAAEHGVEKAEEVSLAVLESFQRWLVRYRKKDGKPLSSRTLRQRLSAVQDYFRWLVRHGLLGANPASELILPRKEARLPEQALTMVQVDELMSVPDLSDFLGIRNRALLELLYGTAMRLGEVKSLALTDLHLEKRIVHIRQGKGAKDRLVPFGQRTLHWMNRYLEEVRPRLELKSGEQSVFLTGYGEGFHPNALGHLVRKQFRAAGIAKGGAHLLRHTCATHLHQGGADIRFVQKLLGHASLETTAIYTEMNIEALREVFESCHPAETRWQERQC